MDRASTIQQLVTKIYTQLENDEVAHAVGTCLRLARILNDYIHIAVFLMESSTSRQTRAATFNDECKELPDDIRHGLWKATLENFIKNHTVDVPISTDDDGYEEGGDDNEKKILGYGISELEADLKHMERNIANMRAPEGMSAYDTAFVANQNGILISRMRLKIQCMLMIRERVKGMCMDYAIKTEKQLLAESKPQAFLLTVQNKVNNYFKLHSDDIFRKLQKAAALVDGQDSEDHALLLTEVRRVLKSVADHYCPVTNAQVTAIDGSPVKLNDMAYMNRMQEYLKTAFPKSTARELMLSEFELINRVARKLDNLASKGVHDNVSVMEAKQGLLALYFLLFNIITSQEAQHL